MVEQERGFCITRMSETIPTKTEAVDKEYIAFQNTSMVLLNMKEQLSVKKCDRLIQSMFDRRAFLKRNLTGRQLIANSISCKVS